MKVKTFTGSETAKVDKRVNDWLAQFGITPHHTNTAIGQAAKWRAIHPFKGRYLTVARTALRAFSRYPKKRKSWTMHYPPARRFGAIALVIAGLFVMACGQATTVDGPTGITRSHSTIWV
jgi:hypothetical protein